MAWGFAALKRWRRERIIGRSEIGDRAWRTAVERFGFLRALDAGDLARLRRTVALFLHDKRVHGAGGLELNEAMRLRIAVQACILILNLDIDYYAGWVEIIVYPDEFIPEHEYVDEHGLVHVSREPHAGEAWLNGPVILSWADVAGDSGGDGVNVVIHEFAHKLDMLNGEANGFPPLHRDMSRAAWAQAFGDAYRDFCARVDAGRYTEIDPYAAESPGEFFAVLSEAFFDSPRSVHSAYPAVYAQLAQFYRQDPAARMPDTPAAAWRPLRRR